MTLAWLQSIIVDQTIVHLILQKILLNLFVSIFFNKPRYN